MKSTARSLALIGVLFAAAVALLQAREQRYPPAAASIDDETMFMTSGAVVSRMSVGFTSLAADLYWMRAIQYYGGNRLRFAAEPALASTDAANMRAYPLLYPLLDVTTTLDPYFNLAYRFGSIFLAEPFPGGAGRPDLAITLLEKGLRARPEKWEYMQDIGFVNYWWRHDYHAAADWFDRASKITGAPWWLRSLAAVTLAEGGDRRSSRLMWELIRESAEIDWLRGEAARRLMQLQALDEIDALQARVDRSGVRSVLPRDPAGTPYEISSEGRVRLSRQSPIYPLPDEPKHMGPPAS